MDPKILATALLDDPLRRFDVQLWDGSSLPTQRQAAGGTVILRTPEVVELLVPPASESALAAAFVDGRIDISGDTTSCIEAIATWKGPSLSLRILRSVPVVWLDRVVQARRVAPPVEFRGLQHSVDRDAKAVRSHYDVSNDFYRLFLDPAMVYSCAFFPTGGESLEEAQQAKLDLVCRKVGLSRGERLLDVGCGWGALLMHAAEQYGARAVGLTVSKNQFDEACLRSKRFEHGQVEVLECDYRNAPKEVFDKVASVGMMEHVGRANLQRYFEEISQRLRPGGLFLNHAIADIAPGDRTVPWTSNGGFVERWVFPDTDLVPIGLVVQEAERAGFEVRDLECLREHYAETLTRWLKNLEDRFVDAIALVGEERARIWRLYLAGSATAFRLGQIGVYQLLLAKRPEVGRQLELPRCRACWYAGFDSVEKTRRRS